MVISTPQQEKSVVSSTEWSMGLPDCMVVLTQIDD